MTPPDRPSSPSRLVWLDVQGDRFLIEPEQTVADANVIASILVGDPKDGQEAAVWVTSEQAESLIDWLTLKLWGDST